MWNKCDIIALWSQKRMECNGGSVGGETVAQTRRKAHERERVGGVREGGEKMAVDEKLISWISLFDAGKKNSKVKKF